MHQPTLALVAALALSGGIAVAGDWPQFRGPDRHGIGDGEGLLRDWTHQAPVERWRRTIGAGYSGVTAVGDRLYTMATDGEKEWLLCLDGENGDLLWRLSAGPAGTSDLGDHGPRSTPTVARGAVFTASSAARLVVASAEDGRLLWERDLTEFGAAPRFGYAVSPLVDGELVLVEAGGGDDAPGILAFDRTSGELRWSALSGPAGYSSPIVVEIADQRQYVFFRRAGAEVVAVSPQGEALWRHPTTALAIIVTPIFLPPDRIFVASADDVFGGLMLRVGVSDGAWSVEELWSERRMRNHFNSSVAIGGHLYGFDNGTFRCLDAASGEPRWGRRGFGKGSLVAADDLLLVLGDDGTLALVEASPEAYREHGRLRAMSGRAWTAPTLAGGRVYLRDFDEIVSYDLRRPAGGTAAAPAGERP